MRIGISWTFTSLTSSGRVRQSGGKVYEVAAQFRVYLVSELRGVLIVVDVNPQGFLALPWLFGIRVDCRKCEAAWALEVMLWDATQGVHL